MVWKCDKTKNGQMDGIPCRSSGLRPPPLLSRIVNKDVDDGSFRGHIVYTTLTDTCENRYRNRMNSK